MRVHGAALRMSVMMMFVVAATTTSTADASGAGHGPAKGKLLAHKFVGKDGGHVRTRSGARLYVPRGALQRQTLVTIARMSNGAYNMHVAGPFSGNVEVTLPTSRRRSVVLHRLGDRWVPEGPPGQRTVWVGQLSPFTWASDKAKQAACVKEVSFRGNPRAEVLKFLQCAARKGLAKLDSKLTQWLFERLGSDPCAAQILASKGAVGAALATMTGGCVGRAGESQADIDRAKEQLAQQEQAAREREQQRTPTPTPDRPAPQPQPAPQPGPGPDPGPSPSTSDRMSMDQRLNAASSDYLRSADGRYRFVMQSDGNLVLYAPSGPIWTTSTNGRGANHLRMQGDGNLVMYNDANRPIWASNTPRYYNAYLVVQNDGNVVIYNDGRSIWSTGTAGRT